MGSGEDGPGPQRAGWDLGWPWYTPPVVLPPRVRSPARRCERWSRKARRPPRETDGHLRLHRPSAERLPGEETTQVPGGGAGGLFRSPPRSVTGRDGVVPATVIVGLQWGDEGKGKATDVLAERVAMVVRYQGGDNAGHTVVLGDQVFKL